jgi:hypothetical protein
MPLQKIKKDFEFRPRLHKKLLTSLIESGLMNFIFKYEAMEQSSEPL